MFRFDYAGPFKTFDRAADVLDDLYASDQIDAADHATVEKRVIKTASWSKQTTRYYITVDRG